MSSLHLIRFAAAFLGLFTICSGRICPAQVAAGPAAEQAAAAAGTPLEDRTAEVEVLREFPEHAAEIFDGTFSPDGRWTATIDRDSRIKIVEVDTGTLMRELNIAPASVNHFKFRESMLAFSPNGAFLAVAARDPQARAAEEIQIFEIATGAVFKRLKADGMGHFVHPRFTASGDRLVAIGMPEGFGARPHICSWTVVDDKLERTIRLPQTVKAFALLPDAVVACAGTDAWLDLVDLKTGDFVHRFTKPRSDVVTYLAATPDGSLLAAADSSVLAVFDVPAKTERFQVERWSSRGLAIGSNGVLANRAAGADLYVIGEKELRQARSGMTTSGTFEQFLALSPDGSRLLVGRLRPVLQEVRWSQENRLIVKTPERAAAVAVSPDGRFVAWADRTSLSLYSSAESKVAATVPLDPLGSFEHRRLEFSPDGAHLALRTTVSGGEIWQLFSATNLELKRTRRPDEGGFNDAHFGPDGKSVYFFGPSVTHIQDVAGSNPPITLPIGASRGQFVGEKLVAATLNTVSVYDRTGKQLQSWNAGRNVTGLAVSADAKLIATFDFSDKRVAVWDAATANLVADVVADAKGVRVAAFSPDGQWLLTSGDDRRLKFWSAKTGKLRISILAHQAGTRGIAALPGGMRMLTYGEQTESGPSRLAEWDLAHLLAYYPEPAEGPPAPFNGGHPAHVLVKQGDGAGFVDAASRVYLVDNGVLKIRDLATGRVVTDLTLGDVESATVSADGAWVAAGYSGRRDAAGIPVRPPRLEPGPAPAEPPASVVGWVKIWNLKTGLPHKVLTLDCATPRRLAFSPDGRTLAVIATDNAFPRGVTRIEIGSVTTTNSRPGAGQPAPEPNSEFSLWEVAAGTRRWKLPHFIGGTPLETAGVVRFDARGESLAFGDSQGGLLVCEAAAGAARFQLKVGDGVKDLRFSPDGKLLAAALVENYVGKLGLLDAATGAKQPGTENVRDGVTAVAFSPDGRMLATAYANTGYEDRGLVFRSLPDLKEVRRVVTENTLLETSEIGFSPDAASLLTADRKQFAVVWRIDHLFDDRLQRDIQALKDAKFNITYLGDLVRVECPSTEIADRDLANLPEFTRPFLLDLNGSDQVTDTGLAALVRQKNLAGLDMAGCSKLTTAGLAALHKMPLIFLDASDSLINDEPELALFGRFTKLETLRLRIDSGSPAALLFLRQLKNLRELSFETTRVAGAAFEALGALPKLEVLRLEFASLTDDDLRHLGRLPKLKELKIDLETQGLTGIGLRNLTRCIDLEVLDLEGCETLNDVGFATFPKLKKLREVNLSNTQVTGRGLSALSASTSIERLKLSEGVTAEGVTQLAKLVHLRELDLSKARGVTDAVLRSLAGMKDLRVLRLPAGVSDAALDHLAAMTDLVELSIENSGITDAGAAKLANLDNLDRLNLTGAPLTDAAVPALERLRRLTHLNLTGTRVTAAGKESLKKSFTGKYIYIEGP